MLRTCIGVVLAGAVLLGGTAAAGAEETAEKDKDCPYAGKKLTYEELKPILEAHAAWVRAMKRGEAAITGRAVLCRSNLEMAELRLANLEGANLERAILSGARLDGADLSRASLEGANLNSATLVGATLVAIDLENANLFSADLENADLESANLKMATLLFARLRRANLRSASCEGANLNDANLEEANLRNAKLARARLGGANLLGANLYNAKLQNANLYHAVMQTANLERADLRNAMLLSAKLQSADLGGANLENAVLQSAHLEKADLKHALLAEADLSNAKLQGTALNFADIKNADLRYVNLRNAVLEGANLRGSNFNGSDLRDANLQYSQLIGASFAKAETSKIRVNLINASFLGVGVDHLKVFEPLKPEDFPEGLVSVREKFKKAGEREEERYLTFLIKRNERREAPWLESAFGYVLFELTSDWGYSPGRPLMIMGALVLVFWLVYLVPIGRSPQGAGRGGIYQVWPKGRLQVGGAGADAPSLAATASVNRLYRSNKLAVLGYGLYFSVISAFHIGWRDLNVGNWINRLQSEEYVLQPKGWVRVVSGAQSLLSVYLLALWALVYFGRPFE